MRIRRLPAADTDPAQYLRGANIAFGHWGDGALFAWAFRGGEILFVDDEQGRTVAGSGITYRTLRNGRQGAILTGSWTLPEARGNGAFTMLIDATHDAAAERGAITLGFGRMENKSRRRLEAAGSRLQPTFYCRSIGASDSVKPLEHVDPASFSFATGFLYTAEEWRSQFLDRPHARIECLGHQGQWAAIIERANQFDRVHTVSDEHALPELAAHAHAAGRQLFWFTVREPSLPCHWTDGFLSTFPPMDINGCDFQNGDRM